MALTESKMFVLGEPAPEFKLKNVVTDLSVTLDELKSNKATVIMFICNHCPFVKHIQKGIVQVANDYIPKGISFIAISSNDVETYPEDRPEKMREVALMSGYPFPYLYDKTQMVAKAYQAACTPEFYIFDKYLICIYHGEFDDSRPGNGKPVTGQAIRNALDNVLAGTPIDPEQTPSQGCNIKWREN